ncbi:unnamed protein product [Linum tenue]|uniref:Uncharacterized protein n=1 Tax=Linum tenue TaxID=586396 RepID=A0AAV0QHY2_9ROSI|nr:unnamed protein product [Linum tenue]
MACSGNQQKRLKTEEVTSDATEEQQYMIIKVVRDEDIRNDIGKTRYFDLADHDKVTSFRVPNLLVFQTLQGMHMMLSFRLLDMLALTLCV